MDRRGMLTLRRDTIKHLIKTNAIEDQATLIELIRKYHGLETNQSAISRDFHQLGVRKGMVDGRLIYELPETNVEAELLRLAITDIIHNESIIVVRTVNGLAAFVGDVLDRHEDIDLLGTIAGENVVFAVPVSIKQINEIFDGICEILYFNKVIPKRKNKGIK